MGEGWISGIGGLCGCHPDSDTRATQQQPCGHTVRSAPQHAPLLWPRQVPGSPRADLHPKGRAQIRWAQSPGHRCSDSHTWALLPQRGGPERGPGAPGQNTIPFSMGSFNWGADIGPSNEKVRSPKPGSAAEKLNTLWRRGLTSLRTTKKAQVFFFVCLFVCLFTIADMSHKNSAD